MQILDFLRKIHRVSSDMADFQANKTDLPTGGPNYYQLVSGDHFYLMIRETITSDVTVTDYYFNDDIDDIDTDWTGRAGLTYVRLDEIIGA